MAWRVTRLLHPPARPPARKLALAAGLGAVIASGQAPLGLWFAALPALALLTLLIAAEARPARAVWLGWVAGAGHFAAALFWIVEPFLVEPWRHGWMAPFALMLMAFGMALFWALAAAVANAVGGASPGRRALGLAIALAGADLLRGYAFTGFPWALIGHVWIGTPVMQAAAFVGPVGLTLIATLAAALPVMARGGRGRAGLALLSAAGLALIWGAGMMRLAAADPAAERPVRVRLIQPNAAQALKWRDDMWRMFLDRQMAQTALPATRPLDLVVWPETAVPYLLDDAGPLFAEIAATAQGVPVAAGIQRAEGARYFNALAVTDAAGRITSVYDKWHLVPFGEYLPYGDLLATFGLGAFAAQSGGGYTPGPGPRVLDLGAAGKVLPLICYEAVFPQDLRTAERADWILQITNDGWFGNLAGPYQHLAQARLRAVEQGLPLLRSANTGVSAVIDAKGRLLQALPLNQAGILDADVPPALPATPYARTGDLPATILIALALLMLLSRRFLPGRRIAIDPGPRRR